ncbi:uncharacterized protein LOC135834068 [Planococcus citri]|uniref:uncharacterized protein LOC135834068 n=1 Tax=Planococcus citri TaxID=170843 RepID=UPI0031F9754C
MEKLRQVVHRERRKKCPALPKSIDEAIQLLKANGDLFKTNQGEEFIFVKESSKMVAVTCVKNLQMFHEDVLLFADGTFSYCPKYFSQLYTLHAFKNGYYIMPLVFFFLPSKERKTYDAMWTFLNELSIKYTRKELKINKIYMDYEIAAHQSIKSFRSSCIIKGCRFHLSQAWYRKIQKDFPLIRREYETKHSEIGDWVKCFFGLSFLPPNDAEEAVAELIEICPSQDVIPFSDYIIDNYLTDESLFPTQLWADAPDDLPRTTNGPEAFHRVYNSMFSAPHPNIWRVITSLLEIQIETYLKITDIECNKIRQSRKPELQRVNSVIEKWTQYSRQEITRLQYLQALGHKFKGIKI